MIRFACPHCGKAAEVEEAYAGRRGPCPSCGQMIEVPQPGSAAGRFVTAAAQGATAAGGEPAAAEPVKTSPWSIASLVCGLLFCLGITGILAISFGILGIRQVNASQGRLKGRGLAIAGIILGGLFGIVCVIGLLLAILWLQINGATETACRMRCAANLRGIYTSIKTYSAAYKERWPTVYSKADDPRAAQEAWGGGWKADDWKLDDRGDSESQTLAEHKPFTCNQSCLWLLVREGKTQPGVFVCPSDEAEEASTLSAQTWWSFESLHNCSYSYQNQLGRNTTDRVEAAVVVLADRSPLRADVTGQPPDAMKDKPRWQWNSPNHKWRGQYCLFGDGHVEFATSPEAGYEDNNIWIRDTWDSTAKKWTPDPDSYENFKSTITDPRDSFLVP